MGFPGSSAGKESACSTGDDGSLPMSGWSPAEGMGYPFQCSWAFLVAGCYRIHLQCGRPGFNSWVGNIPWRRAWQPTSVGSCLESPHGQRNLAVYSPWGHKELDLTWVTAQKIMKVRDYTKKTFKKITFSLSFQYYFSWKCLKKLI